MTFENLGNSIKLASTKDVIFANKTLRKLKSSDMQLRFPRGLDLSSCSIVVFCDASFANLPDKGSQGAHIIVLVDNSGRYCVLNWQSRHIRRQGRQTGGGVGGSQPPLNLGWGVEHLSTPPDFEEKIFRGGVGST